MRKPIFKSLIAILALFISFGFAQSPQQPQPLPTTTPAQSPSPQASPSPQPSATPSHRLEVEPIEKEPKDHIITPAEAKELFRSVDEILHFATFAHDNARAITIAASNHVSKAFGH